MSRAISLRLLVSALQLQLEAGEGEGRQNILASLDLHGSVLEVVSAKPPNLLSNLEAFEVAGGLMFGIPVVQNIQILDGSNRMSGSFLFYALCRVLSCTSLCGLVGGTQICARRSGCFSNAFQHWGDLAALWAAV